RSWSGSLQARPTRKPGALLASVRAPSRCTAPASWTSSAPGMPPIWSGPRSDKAHKRLPTTSERTRRNSLRCRLEAEHLCDLDEAGALLVDRGGKFRRRAGDHDLCRGGQPRMDRWVVQRGFHVGSDALAQRLRHVARAENSDETVK